MWTILAFWMVTPVEISLEIEHPPPQSTDSQISDSLVYLANSVQSNAPPVLS